MSDPWRWVALLGEGMAAVHAAGWEASLALRQIETVELTASRLQRCRSLTAPWLRLRVWSKEGPCSTVFADAALSSPAAVAEAASQALSGCAALPATPARNAAPTPEPPLPAPHEALPAGAGAHLGHGGDDATWCMEEAMRLAGYLAREGVEAYGSLTACSTVAAVVNSRGLATWHRHGSAGICLLAVQHGRTGTSWALRREGRLIDSRQLAEDAAARALASQSWERAVAGPCTVLLEPAAVAALLVWLAPWLHGQPAAVAAALSRPGEPPGHPWPADPCRVAAPPPGAELRLLRFGLDPPEEAPGLAADAQGRPVKSKLLFTAGTTRRAMGGRPAAPSADARASAEGAMDGLFLPYLELAPGSCTVEHLLAQVEDGIWVTRLSEPTRLGEDEHGLPWLHAATLGGTFRIRRGRLGPRLQEGHLAFTPAELVAGLQGMTRERRVVPWQYPGDGRGALVVPSLLVHGLHFGP